MNDAEHDQVLRHIRAVLWDVVDPMVPEIEDSERLPLDRLFPILRDIGAFAYLIPREHGGAGMTISQYVPVIAEFAKVHGGLRALVHVHNSFAHALHHADAGHAKAILPAAATGDASVAFALTEPDHGTGLDTGTTATRSGRGYVITGRKWLITNSDFASHFITIVRTSGEPGPRSLSALLVPRDTEGLRIERLPETMGCKGGEHGLLTFDHARVSDGMLLGDEGDGLDILEQALEISRVLVAASSLGTAERALELALQHARKRHTFGRPLLDRQAVQRYLAEMATDVYTLRGVVADAACRWDTGDRIPAESAMCKLFGLEAVGRVTDRALLVFGGIGYTRAHPIERLYRDARLNWIEEGTPTIQYAVIAQALRVTA